MIDNIYISLKVCGRPHENSGFNPLVYYNSPLFDVPDTVYSGFNDVPYFFSVIIEKTQVVYTIIMNNVRSYQGFRLGNLKIAMSIPKGYKISNGKTPYDALVSIKDYIIASCMTCKDPVKFVYEFNSEIISPTLLDDIAREFPLKCVEGPYHSMSVGGPKGYIILPEEQINLLLSDVQYPEFSTYGEIVIAQSVQATNYTPIVNLQVPRKSRFAIIVDGEEYGYVENPDEEIPVRGKKDPKFYDNQQFSFTISDVRKGQIVPNVVVNEEKEIVSINTTSLSTAKSTKVHIVFPKEVEGYFYTFKEDFQLVYASGYEKKAIILNDYVFTLKGEEIGWLDNPSNFRATFNRAEEYRIKSPNLIKNANGEYQFNISVEKVVRPKPTDSDVIKVDVFYNEPPYNKTVTLCLETKKGHDTLLTTWVSSSRCVFYIPKKWNIRIDDLRVRYETSEDFYSSVIHHDRKSNTYSASDFDSQRKTFVDRKIKPNKTLITSFISILLGFILGCVLIYYAKPIIDKLLKPEPVFECEYCSDIFKSSDLLTSHINNTHLTKVCTECEKRFSNQDSLTKHINEEHVNEERFDTEEKLTDHKKAAHNKAQKATPATAKPFQCGSCTESFDTKTELEEYIENKHNSHYFCHVCKNPDLWFDSMNKLESHVKSKHKRYECPYCGQNVYFTSQEELNQHIGKEHRSEER